MFETVRYGQLESGGCLECVLKVSGECVSGECVSGRCLEGVWKVSGRCL